MQIALALLLLQVSTIAIAEVSNPLGKTIDLLHGLSAKVTADGGREAAVFDAYASWCKEAGANTGFEIKTANSRKEKLEAKIAERSASIAANNAAIDDLTAAIATSAADLKAATEIRNKENADFLAGEAELVDGIDTLSRAMGVISKEMAKNPAAFTQLDTSNMQNVLSALRSVFDAAAFSSHDQKTLLAFVQSRQSEDDSDFGVNAPAAAVYKSHSGGILDALEDLKEKAEAELAGLRKAETNSQHNFDMLKQSLDDQSAADTKDLNEEKASKASSAEAKAAFEGDLGQTKKDLAAAEATLASVEENCATVTANHEATVAARTEELKVLADAIAILQKSTGGAVSQTYSFLQTSSTLKSKADLANSEVVAAIKKLATEHHSAALAQLASRVSAIAKFGAGAGEDPFVKVKGLISDMIARLEAEADAAATEKAYCDEQMARTELKKGELESAIAKLNSKIDQASAKSADLKGQVKEAQGELANLAKEQAEMDSIRNQQHDDYVQAKADLEQGLVGVREALGVLRDYYGAAFVQQPEPPKPELFKASGGAANSIIGILEVVESDFATNLAKEETQEANSAAAYDKETQANAVEKTMKEQDVKYNTGAAVRLDKAVAEMTSDRSTASTELDAVMEFYGKLRARCIAKPETYEVRAARRAAEIQGLKEALAILENEAAFVQRKRRGSIRGALMA